jgi:small subunit ribosomal protein S16
VAVRIRLLRMGKIRNPQYRIVVADSRTKRDGRAIEELGLYHPKEDPSRIEVNSERVQHWLSVGAQPSEAVQAILSKTGDWQRFKGLPPPDEPLKVAPARVDRSAVYEAEAKAAAGLAEAEARPAKRAEPRKAAARAESAPSGAGAAAASEAPAASGEPAETASAQPASAGPASAGPASAGPAASAEPVSAGPASAEEPANAGASAEV